MFAKNRMWILLLTLFFIISMIPPYAEAVTIDYAPGQIAMTFEEYLAQGGETWFLTGKQEYTVQAMMVSKEISFHNELEVADYTVTDDGETVVLKGKFDEMWVSKLPKVISTYTKPDGSEINAEDFAEKDVYIDIISRPASDSYYAMFVPLDSSVTLETAWGDVLHTNLPNAPHGDGDFLVCRVGEDDGPDLSDVWVVNGAVFPEYYDTGNFPDTRSALETIRSRGILRVGTAGDYQPMSFLDPESGTYVGFDAELAEDLAASLGVEVEYVETTWLTLMEDTLAGKFDLAICGITITDARKEQALMSMGYLGNGKTVLCRVEDAEKYTSLEAINRPEVRVMENPGGLNEKFARENLPDATLIIHDVNQEIPGLVASGEADVMITETMEAGYYVGQDDRLAAPLILEPFNHGELGVLMPKDSEDLLEYVNGFIEDEETSGRLSELAEEYIYRYIDREEYLPHLINSIRQMRHHKFGHLSTISDDLSKF